VDNLVIAAIQAEIGGRTDLSPAVAAFTEIVEAGHAEKLVFYVDAIREEILYRLAVSIAVGDRESTAEMIVMDTQETDDGYYDSAAVLVAENLGHLANDIVTLRRPKNLYRWA